MTNPRILLVVGGGIAAYKSCELVRLIRKAGGSVTCVVTEGGQQFVTPMTLAALSENEVYTSLFDLKNEAEMGHIQLSREADLLVVCPATADLMAKMAAGVADDLATTLLLATDKPVMCVPAMNVRMWDHEATQRNVAQLREDGVHVMQPDEGPMACGEFGAGRLPEPEMIFQEIASQLGLSGFEAGQDSGSGDGKGAVAAAAGGLGGLISSIIPRSTKQRDAEEQEQEFFPDDFDGEALPEEALEEGGDASNLLVGKGAASAAPPTDAEAINHEVSARSDAAEPEPIKGDEGNYPLANPLDGQPAFETDPEHRPLYGKHVLVTAGPTRERIDPVRYIANRSSGRQGYAIAGAAAALGARVTLVSGPVHLATPTGVDRVDVETALEMAAAVKQAMPADAAVMVAAVADWRMRDEATEKIKKRGSAPPALIMEENPDILATLASSNHRPQLVVGFAAETQNVIENAQKKRKSKGADWIVANDVSFEEGESVMGGTTNTVHIVRGPKKVESWDEMPKEDVAMKLAEAMADELAEELESPSDD